MINFNSIFEPIQQAVEKAFDSITIADIIAIASPIIALITSLTIWAYKKYKKIKKHKKNLKQHNYYLDPQISKNPSINTLSDYYIPTRCQLTPPSEDDFSQRAVFIGRRPKMINFFVKNVFQSSSKGSPYRIMVDIFNNKIKLSLHFIDKITNFLRSTSLKILQQLRLASRTTPYQTKNERTLKRWYEKRLKIKREYQKLVKNKFIIILAGAGMGKTAFLYNLYMAYIQKCNNRFKIKMLLLVDKSTDELIQYVKDKSNTILLLDGLDEDSKAMENYTARLEELLKKN